MSLSAFLRIHLSIHICSWILYIIAKKQNLFLDLFLLWVFSFLLSFLGKAATKLYILVKWAFFKPQNFFSILYLVWSCTIWRSHEIHNADSFKCTAKQSFIILIYLLWLGGNHHLCSKIVFVNVQDISIRWIEVTKHELNDSNGALY